MRRDSDGVVEQPGPKKREGVAFRPVPLGRSPGRGAGLRSDGGAAPRSREPRCEMCGSVVIASHCKRICLRCGFMTGCSEGI